MNSKELLKWLEESRKLLKDQNSEFSVLVDLRKLKPIKASDLVYFRNGQKLYKQNGLKRSAVVLKGVILAVQFRDIAKKSDIFSEERYLDEDLNPDWEKAALDWVRNGIDPDKS